MKQIKQKLHIKTKKDKQKLLFFIFLFIVILTALILLKRYEFRPTGEEDVFIPEEDTLFYNGTKYTRNKDIASILVVGIDKFENESQGFARNNERADFLMLLAIDKSNNTYKALHINRDSMVNVKELDIKGDFVGYKQMQITLSHTYGSGGAVSAKNTLNAAENLLYNTKIDHYIVYNMDAVVLLADKLGGIPMDDTILSGEEAISYVRYRDTSNPEGNLQRMERQRAFISALKDKIQEKLAQEDNNASALLLDEELDFSKYMQSDLSIYELDNYFNILVSAPDVDILTIDGKNEIGKEYIEYYCDEKSVRENVIKMFYE